jgi:hypothetical protein
MDMADFFECRIEPETAGTLYNFSQIDKYRRAYHEIAKIW